MWPKTGSTEHMHKLTPTMYRTNFGHRAYQTFPSIRRELLLHHHTVGTSQVIDVEVTPGKAEISKIQQETLVSEVRIYDDIIAVSQKQEKYPFSVYELASLMRYINAGRITSASSDAKSDTRTHIYRMSKKYF